MPKTGRSKLSTAQRRKSYLRHKVISKTRPSTDYEVNRIVGHKQLNGVDHYLVQWKDRSSSPTWESFENLQGCSKLIAEYKKTLSIDLPVQDFQVYLYNMDISNPNFIKRYMPIAASTNKISGNVGCKLPPFTYIQVYYDDKIKIFVKYQEITIAANLCSSNDFSDLTILEQKTCDTFLPVIIPEKVAQIEQFKWKIEVAVQFCTEDLAIVPYSLYQTVEPLQWSKNQSAELRNRLLAQNLRMIFAEAGDDIKVWSETENPVKNLSFLQFKT
jgi:hypothetical protein